MPRKPRLDARGLLYHVMTRGLNGDKIFRDDHDYRSFLDRLGRVINETKTPIYAFCLIPNHFHILLRRDSTPIGSVMRRLLTGYAITFNKRHKRTGYLFQNRYKAVICEDEPYLYELIRYINLNPLRAGLVSSLTELDNFIYSSHSNIIGKSKNEWFDPDIVLSHFADTKRRATNKYMKFIDEGLSMGKKPEYTGGGLKRSLGFPALYPKTKQAFDERILGNGAFVEKLLALAEDDTRVYDNKVTPESIIDEIIIRHNINKPEIFGSTKNRKVASARAMIAISLSKEMGMGPGAIAKELNTTSSAIVKMIRKSEKMVSD